MPSQRTSAPIKLPDGRSLYTYSDGTQLTVINLGKGLTLHATYGSPMAEPMADDVIADGEKMLQEFGRCIYLVDGRASGAMSTGFRNKMTSWFGAHRTNASAHLLQNSKLIVMALSIANMLVRIPIAYPYTKVEEWQKIMTSELGTFYRFNPRLLDPPTPAIKTGT